MAGPENCMNDEAASDDTGLQLPYDRPLTPGSGTHWAALEFELPPIPTAVELDPFGPAALLLAVFAAQLARYSGQSAVPLLVSVMGRALGVGGTHVVSFDTHPEASGASLLDQARRALDPRAGAPAAGGLPAAVTLFDDQRSMDSALAAARDSAPQGTTLQLVACPGAQQTRLAFAYNERLFDARTITRLVEHFSHLHGQMTWRAAEGFEALDLLTPAEAAAVRAAGTGASVAYPPVPLHLLIAARAAASPNAVAVRFRDTTLEYGALEARANRLAHALCARGAGRESRIVVCLEPGFDIAVTLLGILKSGAVYVPLDPNYPPARIQAILDDTRPAVVVSRAPLLARLGLAAGQPTLCLDEDAAAIEAQPSGDPGVTIELTQTAYIFYTSGTTGKPKGVMASHRNLIFYILSAQRRYAFDASDVMPAIARFSFSISLFELLSPLAAGGTLLLLEREHVIDPARMTQTLQEVTFFHAGPSLLRGLVVYIRKRHSDFSVFARVRHASSGGDMIPPDLLESMKEIFARAEVFVIYGCSEIACMGCTYPVPRDRTVARTYVGSPFENVAVRVFDAQHRPVPFGVVGEICFAGSGVVNGYLNRDELTAEKFFSAEGLRFYGTGDMGRLNAHGELEILGRRDFQIQLRGMRIELGELEYALRKASGVRDGVVAAHVNPDGEKTLVAYVVFHPDVERSIAAVRQHMIDSLPDYMVPTYYIELPALPLNHNMKVDRRALPPLTATDRRVAAATSALRAAETETEALLVDIWCRLLGIEEVGIDDNFFELGGHSLLAFELISEIETRIGVALDGMDVLRESLEVLAGLCDERRGQARAKPARAVPAPASPAFESLFFGPQDSLFGVYFPVSGRPLTAALICPPVATEYVRAHFVLRKLATQLARSGVPALRFDYFGTGDSLGENIEADCARWKRDIGDAVRELARRSGAQRIVAVGVRLGGTLLMEVARELGIARVVLWDPVLDGAEHLADLRQRHHAYMRSTRYLRPFGASRSIAAGEELLGFAYSAQALSQITRLDVQAPVDVEIALSWLDTSGKPEFAEIARRVCGARPALAVEAGSYDCHWEELTDLEDILPDVGISRSLARMVQQ
jgi:amino acid adenylation domain-containing protein